jgi:hypothetical protein
MNEELESKFLNQESFFRIINEIVMERDVDFIEAIIEYCAANNIDVEDVVPLIDRTMKEKIKLNAMDQGLMKREGRLPI